jgi:hypothetical protein
MQQSQPKLWQQLVVVTVTVAGSVMIAWAQLPPDQRAWTVLEVRSWLRKTAHRTAQRAGRLGMASEVAGHDPTAQASYGAAYRLSVLRDRL